jgi:hypothetical protein
VNRRGYLVVTGRIRWHISGGADERYPLALESGFASDLTTLAACFRVSRKSALALPPEIRVYKVALDVRRR